MLPSLATVAARNGKHISRIEEVTCVKCLRKAHRICMNEIFGRKPLLDLF